MRCILVRFHNRNTVDRFYSEYTGAFLFFTRSLWHVQDDKTIRGSRKCCNFVRTSRAVNDERRQTVFVPLCLETQVFRQALLHHLDELVALVPLRALHDPVVVRRRRFELAVKRTDATAQSTRRRHAVGGIVVAVGSHHCRRRRRPVVPVVMLRFVRGQSVAIAFPTSRRVPPRRRRCDVTVLRLLQQRRRRRLSDGKRHFDGSLSARRRQLCRRPVHGLEYFRRQSLDVLRRNGNVGLNFINRKLNSGQKHSDVAMVDLTGCQTQAALLTDNVSAKHG